MHRFGIIKDYVTKVKRFNVRGRKVEFKIRPVPNKVEPVGWVKDAIKDVLEYATENLELTDKMGITFCGKSFQERGPGWINFKNVFEVKLADVWEMISKIFQSNSEGISTDSFCMGITSVRLPKGKGNRRNKYNSFNEESAMRRGIVTIKNNDGWCLPRALVVAIAHTDKDPEYAKIRKDTRKIQTKKSAKLINDVNIEIPSEGCGIPELRRFQDYLKTYKIVVYQYGTKGRDVVFEGSGGEKRLNLLYHRNHYNVITSLTAAFCCGYFCEDCHIPYNSKNDHRCAGTCSQCQQSPVCTKCFEEILCNDCNRYFKGQQCFDNHKSSGSINSNSVCALVNKCTKCLKTYKTDKTHMCGEWFCKICKEHVPQDHLCFIQIDKSIPKSNDILYVFYDLETKQEKVLGTKIVDEKVIGEIKQHQPNLCVFQQRCSNCVNEECSKIVCETCGVRLQIIRNQDIIASFVHHLISLRKKFKHIIVIAHNGQAFDHQFILNYILQHTDLKPELIMRGTKIILMQLKNVKFIDSLNYFPMALSKLPKAFDLQSTLKKGYFPYLFNTFENENYIGPIPPIEYYGADTMKADDREMFLQWYEKHKNNEFNMQKEIVEYCVSDVKILTEACLKFRKLLLNECNVDPFLEATTIASTCNLVFRRNFLEPNTIGIVPKNGYRFADNQSKEAIQWLVWEEDQRKIYIQHAGKEKEAIVAGVKIDGFCKETNQVFEFHGCYYHGHPSCLPQKRDEPLYDDPNDTLSRRYERTIRKTERLRSMGYEVIEMWGCEFSKQMKTNTEMNYLNTHPLINTVPLNPRDAFYGGRTGNIFKYYKCKPDEKIKYVDVCSLYPWVCKNGKFPVGHPTLYIGNEECSKINLNETNGLIKCRILPPENLYHPVLPIKQNNKLMFTLCNACGNTKNQNEMCNHRYMDY